MLISGCIFADNALENISLRLLQNLDACSCGCDVVNAVCLVFYFLSLMPIYFTISFELTLILDLGG